jgi:hypothetical protein
VRGNHLRPRGLLESFALVVVTAGPAFGIVWKLIDACSVHEAASVGAAFGVTWGLVASPSLAETTVEHRYSDRGEYVHGLDLALARIGFQRSAPDNSATLVYRSDRSGALSRTLRMRTRVRVLLGPGSATLVGPRRVLTHLGG